MESGPTSTLRYYKPLAHRAYIFFLGCLPLYLGVVAIDAAFYRKMLGIEEWAVFTFGLVSITFSLLLWRYVLRPLIVLDPSQVIIKRFLGSQRLSYKSIERLGYSIEVIHPKGKARHAPVRIYTVIMTSQDGSAVHFNLPQADSLKELLDALQTRSGVSIKPQRL